MKNWHLKMMSFNFEKVKISVISSFCGYLFPAAILPLHIYTLSYFWSQYSRHVERNLCSCSCWDTVFKGPYETGVASYKHMYFNATSNGSKMWIFTILAVLALYESVKRLVHLSLIGKLRCSMGFLFMSTLFSHYYSWWGFINYWNDDFYSQWNHQMFFTVTELASTIIVLYLANIDNPVIPQLAFTVSGVGALHSVAAGSDQFIVNVVQGKGQAHQVVRDLFLMLPDILHFFIPIMILSHASWKRRRTPFGRMHAICKHRGEIVAVLVLVILGVIICSMI